MFKIVMCLEEGIPRKELNQDASYAPDIAGE
jgi:hypothetical protein